MEGLRLPKSELKRKFGLSERMAVRIGALQSKGLLVTEALLEDVMQDGDLAKLLLHPDLLSRAPGLNTEDLRTLSAAGKTLGIYEGIIALEEEAIAEKEWGSEKKESGALSPHTAAGLGAAEAQTLFSGEELSRLKLTILTGVDADAKREALRRLALSPLSLEEKGAITLHVLGDADSRVRCEAVVALQHLGMDAALSDLLSTLAEGPSHAKLLALQRIEALRDKVAGQEQNITLGCLVATLKFEEDSEVRVALLSTLTGFSELLSSGNEPLVSLVRWLVKALAKDSANLSVPARKLLLSPEMAGSPGVGEVLWAELEGIRNPAIRSFFQAILCGMNLGAERRGELATQVARDLATIPTEDLSAARLSEAMTLLADDGLRALQETFPTVSEDARGFYLKMIDAAASMEGVSDSLRNKTGEIFRETLKSASRAVRGVIMETNLCTHPGLTSELKRDLCIDIVRNLHLLRSDQLVEGTVSTLARMGGGILTPLQETIRESAYPVEREVAFRALEEIAIAELRAPELLPFFRSLEEEDLLPTGKVVRAVGKLCSQRGLEEAVISGIFRDYSGKVADSAHRFDLISALAWISSAPSASRQMAADTALQLIRLFESNLPSPDVTKSETEDGTLFVLGTQTEVYTDLLPDVIGGIARLVCSGKLAPGVCKKTTGRLLEKYDAVMEYREVWAPGNVVELGEALSRIARYEASTSEVRKSIIETLLKNARNLASARILSEVFSSIEEPGDPFSILAEQCINHLFELRAHPAYREREDQRVLVAAIGRMALVSRLGTSSGNSHALKTRAVEALLEEYGPGYPEGSRVLRRLSESEHLPPGLINRISAAERRG